MIKQVFLFVFWILPIVNSQFTASPTTPVIETEAPVAAPTLQPTVGAIATESPTLLSTSEPTQLPTAAPVAVPVALPVAVPVAPPPTVAPIPSPVAAPTPPPLAPIVVSTSAPTLFSTPDVIAVTPSPTAAPIIFSSPIATTLSPTTRQAIETSPPTSTSDSGSNNPPPTNQEDDELLSLPAWIGIGVGGLIVLGSIVFVALRGGGNSSGQTVPSRHTKDTRMSSQPEVEIQITNDDDISTIGYPTVATRSYRGDQQSLPTIDYDYTRSYGAGQDGSVVSSAAGTMGDTVTPSVTTTLLNRMGDTRAPSERFSKSTRVVEIVAPAGKLGVVLDASDDPEDPIGCPVVHTVKENSPLIGQLQVGDKLIALDDDDVRGMTAMQVSKLISMKSANPRRKFTVLRPL
ncbi:hypothetical protein FisN_38Lh009 [Fistulifera solaris]|uniref:PDZ domain-containing protein n=1 Tax=Fistulifera solaris TaxID=1519565 RepID=A0A1Z5J6Y8_FISSO|nr:hypothetical protein FisN_38Lh009 [Fistulifera solaris]|eukprot:GAX09588.1 hypothetical protein FisN_38Lh009 [Fistulifera solaris]